MRKIGGHVGVAGGLENAISNTLSLGANAMQIFAGSPRIWARSLYDAKSAENFKQLAIKNDISKVYIHALYLTNLASDNPEILAKSITALTKDMQNSALIDSAGVVLHIGSHQGRGWDHDKSQVIDAIKTTLSQTPENSYLLLENSAGQKGKIGSLKELKDILDVIPSSRLKVCLDTAHAFEAGYNFTTADGIQMWVDEIESTIGIDKVELLHLNDSKTPLGSGRDNHQNIGEGFIGDEGMSMLINHPRLAHLPLILEVPGIEGTGPDKENIERVKKLLT